ncbi:MAG: type II secretion system F family protein [Lachnospiraceae bacterium]|nr:type II secretion system F family protein [Lachnospiraceae bacterium]
MGRKNSEHKSLNKNVKTALLILGAGLLLSMLLFLKNKNDPDPSDELIRDEDGRTHNVKLIAASDYGEEEIDIKILSRTYSLSEAEALKDGFLEKLNSTILGENSSFDSIKSDLYFPDRIEGYPFDIEYRVRPRGYVDPSGKITDEIDEDTDIGIEVTYYLEGFEEKEMIEGVIKEPEITDDTRFFKKLKQYLNEKNENERNDKNITLPEELDGVKISWSRKKNNKIPSVIAMTLLCAFLVLFKDMFSFGENEKKKREAIIDEYPDFAVKYALLNEAGLTHRQVIERLGAEYKKNKKNDPLYEEVYKASTDIKGGLSLNEALEKMASECNVREITFFVGRITRNIKKGGKDFAEEVRNAAEESGSEKREKIRRKAETAGTRLLIPMVFLLIIVFALIMIPAFDSFSF